MVKSLEGLRERRDNLIMEIKKDEEKRREIDNYIKKLELEFENLNGIISNLLLFFIIMKNPWIENMR